MDQPITVTTGEDELVARTVFPGCGCEPVVAFRRDGDHGEYRCGCGNELIVGPGAAERLSPAGAGTSGSHETIAPWGEPVEVAWLVSEK